MSKHDITERLEAILEDIFRHSVNLPLWEEVDVFLDTQELARFRADVIAEFDLEDDFRIEEQTRFNELLEDLSNKVSE